MMKLNKSQAILNKRNLLGGVLLLLPLLATAQQLIVDGKKYCNYSSISINSSGDATILCSDDTKNDDTKNDDTKSDDTKNDDTKNDDTKNDDTKNDDTKNDDTKNDDTKQDLDRNGIKLFDIKTTYRSKLGLRPIKMKLSGNKLYIVNNGAGGATLVPSALNGKDNRRLRSRDHMGLTSKEVYAVRFKTGVDFTQGVIQIKTTADPSLGSTSAKYMISKIPGSFDDPAGSGRCTASGYDDNLVFSSEEENDRVTFMRSFIIPNRCQIEAGEMYYLNIQSTDKYCSTGNELCNAYYEISGDVMPLYDTNP